MARAMATAAPELLERAHLVDALEAALADAADGSGRLVLVRGEAGVGKTAFVRRVAVGPHPARASCGAAASRSRRRGR